MPSGGLVTPTGAPKAALKRLIQIRQHFREGRSFAPLINAPIP